MPSPNIGKASTGIFIIHRVLLYTAAAVTVFHPETDAGLFQEKAKLVSPLFHLASNHQPFPVNSGNIAMP